MKTNHTHETIKTSEPRGFAGPVASGDEQNPRAHGNIEVTETCSCGATRRVLINGLHEETGDWATTSTIGSWQT